MLPMENAEQMDTEPQAVTERRTTRYPYKRRCTGGEGEEREEKGHREDRGTKERKEGGLEEEGEERMNTKDLLTRSSI